MPYSDPDYHRFMTRTRVRSKRHPGWRQTFVDCNGECQWRVNGSICRERDTLEFHEQYGEDHNGDGRFQQRILYCNAHHNEAHNDVEVNDRRYASKLQEDVCIEVEIVGGYRQWLEKYGLKERVAV